MKTYLVSDKINPTPRKFAIVGNCTGKNNHPYTILVQELSTGEISFVESEWFNQRNCKLQGES